MVEAIIPTKADAKLLRHYAKLSLGFWTGPTRRKAALFVLGLFGCLVLNLIPAIAVNRWNKSFFDALQNKDHRLILFSIGLMLALALISASTSVALLQMRMRFQLRWREWLTRTLVRRWMERRRFYQLSVLRLVDNPEARIAEEEGMPAVGMGDGLGVRVRSPPCPARNAAYSSATAGAIMNPWPTKPESWWKFGYPAGPRTGLLSGVTS